MMPVTVIQSDEDVLTDADTESTNNDHRWSDGGHLFTKEDTIAVFLRTIRLYVRIYIFGY